MISELYKLDRKCINHFGRQFPLVPVADDFPLLHATSGDTTPIPYENLDSSLESRAAVPGLDQIGCFLSYGKSCAG
jgi:hypothetical protein